MIVNFTYIIMELEINFICVFIYKKSFSKLGGIKMLKLDRRKLDLILAEKCYNLVDLTKKLVLVQH